MKKYGQAIINALLLLIFMGLGLMVRNSKEGIFFDVSVLSFLHRTNNETLFSLMKAISFIGSEIFLFPAMGILLAYMLYKKNYHIFSLLIFNTLGSSIINNLLKLFFNRSRPLEFMKVSQGGLSYPSGHSMVTMSMYLAIAYLITRNESNNKKKLGVYALMSILIISMGLSRIYLGVHWPTDIIGGYIGGYLVYTISKRVLC